MIWNDILAYIITYIMLYAILYTMLDQSFVCCAYKCSNDRNCEYNCEQDYIKEDWIKTACGILTKVITIIIRNLMMGVLFYCKIFLLDIYRKKLSVTKESYI